MRLLNALLSISLLIAPTAIAANISKVSAETITVEGKTNSGNTLKFSTESVGITNNLRNFNYGFNLPDNTLQVHKAYTVWCMNGKIQLDNRVYLGGLNDLQTINLKSTPSWFIYNSSDVLEIVKADSSASINLLKAICQAHAVEVVNMTE